ncbi:MAG TPA: hypothetical protein VLF61_02695 [Rhabdochlamydiaceae bacterium]|nr:hypothetical protein [Rhabdochlamydiaceae bacterium]
MTTAVGQEQAFRLYEEYVKAFHAKYFDIETGADVKVSLAELKKRIKKLDPHTRFDFHPSFSPDLYGMTTSSLCKCKE